MSVVRINDVRVKRVEYRRNVRVLHSRKKTVRNNEISLRVKYYTVSINEVRLYLKMVRWRCSDDELYVLMEFSRDEHSFEKIRCT